MGFSNAVWGIDIGHCALKALRCTLDDDGQTLNADAYDYIEYPKNLSQPEANPAELIQDALETFLSRNNTRGDKIALAVPGHAGLSRFFKPPPVDSRTIPDIVKYEARQQIPFPLEDVVWDYQVIGGTHVDDIIMDSEVGIFAMKRDQVFRSIKPLTDLDVEPFYVQLAPLAVYNYVVHDLLDGGPDPDEFDPDDPPESLVILAIGTETTDLVITNGMRIWQRSIPLGGNHFTKQLSRELKLTYAKAEHLKRNARQAEDAKAVFQAMRPVFNDFVTEVQRSINYFQNIDRQTKIGRMVMLGNTVKLPGLRQYLAKNLGQDVIKVDEFRHFKGSEVKSAPQFKDNVLSFPVCYGLCSQGLGAASVQTNLLPQEFTTRRLVREKKPWALAAVAALLVAFVFNYTLHNRSWLKAHDEFYEVKDTSWKKASSQIQSAKSESDAFYAEDSAQLEVVQHVKGMGEEVVGAGDRKLMWVELYRAINLALPVDPEFKDKPDQIRDPMKYPFAGRPDIYVDHIESEFFEDLTLWWTPEIQAKWKAEEGFFAPKTAEEPAEGEAEEVAFEEGEEGSIPGPTEAGWVIQIRGHHFHNTTEMTRSRDGDSNYLRKTFLKNMREGKISLPIESTSPDKAPKTVEFTIDELGVAYPTLVWEGRLNRDYTIRNPRYVNPNVTGEEGGAPGLFGVPLPGRPVAPAAGDPKEVDPDAPEEVVQEEFFPAPRYDFIVQFVWKEKRLRERLEIREQIEREKSLAEAAEAEDAANTPTEEEGE